MHHMQAIVISQTPTTPTITTTSNNHPIHAQTHAHETPTTSPLSVKPKGEKKDKKKGGNHCEMAERASASAAAATARRVTVVDVEDQSSGIVLKRGILQKRGKRLHRVRWIKRYFVLQDTALKQFDKPESLIKVSWKFHAEADLVGKKTLDISHCTVAPMPGEANAFCIRLPSGVAKIFRAGDPADFQEWMAKLLQASSMGGGADNSMRRDQILRQPNLSEALTEAATADATDATMVADSPRTPRTARGTPDREALFE
jgi:hypothetical protein